MLYVGVTNNIIRRVWEHKQKLVEGFTKKYNITKLVFMGEFTTPEEAISAEKQIKGWLRSKKIELISKYNPHWEDLYEKLLT